MKRAQNVAEAVVKTRSSLSSWSCMGARRRTVIPLANSNEEGDGSDASLLSNRTSASLEIDEAIRDTEEGELDYVCSRGLELDETEEEETIQVDH
ncbi:hypothetical protein FRX31_029068, partial [Thalictrum thalictroides]